MKSVENEGDHQQGDSEPEGEEVEDDSEEESEFDDGRMDIEELSTTSAEGSGAALPVQADHQSPDSDEEEGSESDSSSETYSDRSRRSLAPSPTDSLAEHAAKMSLASDPLESHVDVEPDSSSPFDPPDLAKPLAQNTNTSVKDRVAADVARHQARQSKFHSKRSARKIGRPKGSKAKQDSRVKVEKGGFWE